MKKYCYSAKMNGFYCSLFKDDYDLAGTWPDDAMSVDDDVYNTYTKTPPEGKILGADINGKPCWVELL